MNKTSEKIMLCDLHTHTEYSFDGKEKIEDICTAAVNAGLSAVAITNHYDHDGIEEGIYEEYLFEKDKEDIYKAKEKFKDRIDVIYGIEIGQPHTISDKNLSIVEKMGFEFIIGSLHNLKNSFDFYYLDYKKTTPLYDKGIYKKYVNELKDMARCPFIHTLGHITYPERYMKEAGKDFIYSEFEEDFRELFSIITQNKISLEINTSGLRQGLSHTMPDTRVLKLFKECGGEYVTTGSDAHYSAHVGMNIKETCEIILKSGLTLNTFFKK